MKKAKDNSKQQLKKQRRKGIEKKKEISTELTEMKEKE